MTMMPVARKVVRENAEQGVHGQPFLALQGDQQDGEGGADQDGAELRVDAGEKAEADAQEGAV